MRLSPMTSNYRLFTKELRCWPWMNIVSLAGAQWFAWLLPKSKPQVFTEKSIVLHLSTFRFAKVHLMQKVSLTPGAIRFPIVGANGSWGLGELVFNNPTFRRVRQFSWDLNHAGSKLTGPLFDVFCECFVCPPAGGGFPAFRWPLFFDECFVCHKQRVQVGLFFLEWGRKKVILSLTIIIKKKGKSKWTSFSTSIKYYSIFARYSIAKTFRSFVLVSSDSCFIRGERRLPAFTSQANPKVAIGRWLNSYLVTNSLPMRLPNGC